MLRGEKLRQTEGNILTMRYYILFFGIAGIEYVKVLGVDKGATHEEIKKAYRAKAREFHPDKHANANKEEQVSVAQNKRFLIMETVSRT